MKVIFLKKHGIIEENEVKDLAPEIASYLLAKKIVKKYETATKKSTRKQTKK